MIRSGALMAGLFALQLGAVGAADDAFEPCRSLEPGEKTACLERAVSRSPLDRRTLRMVQGLVTSDPGTARELAGLLLRHHAGSLAEEPGRKAELLDLQGQAFFELGQFDDSARAFEAALELDSGVTQLTWITADGGEGWSAEIDAGAGRLERAARSLLRKQRGDDAARLMAHAVSLGGTGWSEAERSSLDAAGITSKPASAAMLIAPPWFLPIPDIEIELFGEEEPLSIGEFRGRVVLLDFWATWCSPCKDELPQLQKLHEAEHERGLVAVAVNVQEPVHLAMPYVRALGLTMPIGKYNKGLDQVFKVSRLPSLIVIDQQGRARDRWDGYEWGVDRAVAELVRDLLSGAADPPAREVARVIEGEGLLEIDWLRQLTARADGISVVPVSPRGGQILVSTGRSLVLHEPDSRTARTWRDLPFSGRLAIGPIGAGGVYTAAVFRQGSAAVTSIAMPEGGSAEISAPSPVFDVEWFGSSTANPSTGGLVVGAQDGLLRLDAETGQFQPIEGFGIVSAIVASDGGLVALEAGGRMSRLDRELNVVARRPGPQNGWILVEDRQSDGLGVAPPNVTATAAGRFLEGETRQVALATRTGQLVLFDLAAGEVRFRAVWEGPITDLASGDLDGDGFDELVIAAGNDLGVLRRPTDDTD